MTRIVSPRGQLHARHTTASSFPLTEYACTPTLNSFESQSRTSCSSSGSISYSTSPVAYHSSQGLLLHCFGAYSSHSTSASFITPDFPQSTLTFTKILRIPSGWRQSTFVHSIQERPACVSILPVCRTRSQRIPAFVLVLRNCSMVSEMISHGCVDKPVLPCVAFTLIFRTCCFVNRFALVLHLEIFRLYKTPCRRWVEPSSSRVVINNAFRFSMSRNGCKLIQGGLLVPGSPSLVLRLTWWLASIGNWWSLYCWAAGVNH